MSQEPLAKVYDPKDVEPRWREFWEAEGFFRADPGSDKTPFAIVIPPPNVTGSLHIGHAFTNTLQDVIVRWKRMLGFDVLWLPGLDHAGIATQMVVERQLAKEGKRKEDLGRAAFEERIWKWKCESGGIILKQLRLMGFSLDWTRERFTLDPMLSRAVREVFVSLHEAGLIYRGNYIVNWCPRCVTALSDLEVETEPEPGSLWHIRYPAKDGGEGIVVATTRPETMLGDTGVAVHPDDERHRHLVGRSLLLPIAGREIPVVADPFVDREFGTGAVKLTPAHDANDFEAAKRLGLPSINILDERGVMNENAGPFAGQDRFEARKGIVERLQAEGLLVKTTPHIVPLGRCQRCRTVVEPRLSTQWFVKMAPLAEPAIQAVEDGRIVFTPESWSKTYFEWMRNIRDWCISRQLWWGHRIPAWSCAGCDEITVAREEPKTCPKCGGSALEQDKDVLDTWFSSALFPFSTLGWPDKTPDLARYYPNDVMMTGFDIIFFWVARMIVMGLRFGGNVPFRTVFINGLVRDEKGEKMSKVKGNSVDPLDVMEQHGTDALRFTLVALAAPGTDPSFGEGRLLGYKAFVNKLWNASRFVLMNLEAGERAASYDVAKLPLPSRWILERLNTAVAETNAALAAYRFDVAAHTVYHFLWDEFCDWYLEIAKPYLSDPEHGPVTRLVLLETLDTALRLLHPMMPFVTEEIWQRLPRRGAEASIMVSPFPTPRPDAPVGTAAQMDQLIALVTAIRTIRASYEVEPRRPIDVKIAVPGASGRELLEGHQALVKFLGRIQKLEIAPEVAKMKGEIVQPVGAFEVHIPMAGLFDLAAEKGRLAKESAKIAAELLSLRKKLANPQFVERAKPEVVAECRQREGELVAREAKIATTLSDLGSEAGEVSREDTLRDLLAARGWPWRAPVEHHECIASTSDRLKDLARAGALEGTVVVADRQTAGRGRQGRTWDSPPGNLYLSALLRPSAATRSALLPLAAGVAVAEGLEGLGLAAQLKWPNDVVIGERKVGGILAESSATGSAVDWVVVGIGVNVRAPLAPELRETAVCLADVGGAHLPVEEVFAAVLAGLSVWYHRLRSEGGGAILHEWRRRSIPWWGKPVEAWFEGNRITGRAAFVDDEGGLVLQMDDGSEKTLRSGEVRRLRPVS